MAEREEMLKGWAQPFSIPPTRGCRDGSKGCLQCGMAPLPLELVPGLINAGDH